MTKRLRQSKGSAKHSIRSFYEQQAISLVSAWIAETKRAMPDLKALDRWPNIDGYIEVTDEKGSWKGDLKVQVKKLSNTNARNKQHYFNKNDKFLPYCRESEDEGGVPIIFIGVDLKNEQAFWLHIDRDFLNRNGSSRTVKFVEAQVIKSGTSEFVEDWKNIVALYRSKSKEFEKYKNLFSMLSDVINPALGKIDERFVSIHRFLDTVNHYLDHEFSIVKQILYSNTWKLGFAYYRYGDSELAYTLYPIARNKNDAQIKEIDQSLNNRVQNANLGFTGHFIENPLKKEPKEYATEVVRKNTQRVIDRKLLRNTGSEFLAIEFIFAFIDEFHIPMGLELKDKYSLEEIRVAFYIYLPLWLKFSDGIISFPQDRFPRKTEIYYQPNWASKLSRAELNKIRLNVEKALLDDEPIPKIPPIVGEQNSFDLFVEFFEFLKKAKRRGIRRPYKKKDFSKLKEKGNNRIHRLFSDTDTEYNLGVFLEHLLDAYNAILRNNFPALIGELSLFGEADTILVSPDLKGRYYKTYKMYYLKSKTKKKQVRIKPITEEDIKRYELEYPDSENFVYFEREKYQLLLNEPKILEFIYGDTPVLNFIYKILKERIDEYFKETDLDTKFDKRDEADETE